MKSSWIALCCCLAAVAVLPSGAAAADPPPLPSTDAFYTAPSPIPDVAPGTVLRSRPAPWAEPGYGTTIQAWQLLYRTTDTHGRPQAAVTTLLVPTATAPAGGRRLVAYAIAEDGLSTACAPSYQMRQGIRPNEAAPLLRAGTALVVPDYEGPDSAFTSGMQAGHAILDAIRAATSFAPAGFPGRKTRVGLWGYSGGGQAAAWAAELHGEYAPDVDVAGVAFGGAPADMGATLHVLDGAPYSGVVFLSAIGLSRAYPEAKFTSLYNAKGREMLADLADACLTKAVVGYGGQRLADYVTVPDVRAVPAFRKVLKQVNLGQRAPGFPVHVYQGTGDELNPVTAADALVTTYCRAGTPVDYSRLDGKDHLGAGTVGIPAAIAWLQDRLAGVAAPSTCPAGQSARKPVPVAVSVGLSLLRRTGSQVRFSLTQPATVELRLLRGSTRLGSIRRHGAPGPNRIAAGSLLRRGTGRLRLQARATSTTGQHTRWAAVTVKG